jgi:hypothetical protein
MESKKMNRLLIVFVAALAAFLITSLALASEPDSGVLAVVSKLAQDLQHAAPNVARTVRCDRGESLRRAIKRSRPGTTLRIRGVCYESVIIDIDDIVLLGRNGATIDGGRKPSEGVVVIDNASNVRLQALTIQNGADQGVIATRQSLVTLHDVVLRNNGTIGLSVDRSQVELANVSMNGNGTGGLYAFTASVVLATGDIEASNNAGDGITINGNSFFELRGSSVVASDNLGTGVAIINASRLQIFSFPEAQGSGVTAERNGFAGIAALGAEIGVVGSEYFGSGANVLASRNNVIGFLVPAGTIISPHATARFIAEGNGVGMVFEDGAKALIVGGLQVSGNGSGISADGAGTLSLISVPPNPSIVDGNSADLHFQFGSRATIDGVQFSTISCDTSALVRGSASCP